MTASVAGRSTSTVQRGASIDGWLPVQTGENVAEMLSGCDETAAVGASGAMAAFLTNDAAVIRARGRLLIIAAGVICACGCCGTGCVEEAVITLASGLVISYGSGGLVGRPSVVMLHDVAPV